MNLADRSKIFNPRPSLSQGDWSKHLLGHTSPETAFVVHDYPYGFGLWCKIRYWLEYKSGYGYRLVSQTTNPKLSAGRWNKPKTLTYCALAVMVQRPANAKGFEAISYQGLSGYEMEEKLEAFVAEHAKALQGLQEQKVIAAWREVTTRAALRFRAKKFFAIESTIH
jgi:hypothetical protein